MNIMYAKMPKEYLINLACVQKELKQAEVYDVVKRCENGKHYIDLVFKLRDLRLYRIELCEE